jgi:2-polyprenyl-3-methyl-5-hydroxy-6-metoxy-1,4-benzoquinol methylase
VSNPIDLSTGTYARKQIYCASRLVSWSHRRRFLLAATLVAPSRGGRLLDYGCGDGTFIAMVHGQFSACVGADNDGPQLAECAARLGALEHTRFVRTDALGAEESGAYDVVTCMEVLEHCVDEVRAHVIAELRRLVAPRGRVIVSVPIEIGPALVAKQGARRIAAWRNLGDYRQSERYTVAELARMTALPGGAPIARAAYEAGEGPERYRYYGHKGFDWRTLEGELARVFAIDERRFSPMPRLGRWLNSQAWMICTPR